MLIILMKKKLTQDDDTRLLTFREKLDSGLDDHVFSV